MASLLCLTLKTKRSNLYLQHTLPATATAMAIRFSFIVKAAFLGDHDTLCSNALSPFNRKPAGKHAEMG